jgi:hypothetical protein
VLSLWTWTLEFGLWTLVFGLWTLSFAWVWNLVFELWTLDLELGLGSRPFTFCLGTPVRMANKVQSTKYKARSSGTSTKHSLWNKESAVVSKV